MDPRKDKNHNLLALVDLDLAYEWSYFVNTITPDPFFFTDEENM